MDQMVLRSLKRHSLWLAQCVLIAPLLLCGCYDSQSETHKPKLQSTGIGAIHRFFPFSPIDQTKPEAARDTFETFPSILGGISDRANQAEGALDLGIAMPATLSADQNLYKSFSQPPLESTPFLKEGNTARKRTMNIGGRDLPLLDTSFSLLYASIFGSGRSDKSPADEEQDEFENPFTKAKQQQEQASGSLETETDQTKGSEAKPSFSAQDSNGQSVNTPAGGAGAESQENRFLIVGDFDGSGNISATLAKRSRDTGFVTPDGEFDFNLFISYAALEQQSAFYIDDINSDGAPDFLLASQASLFGGVYLGDGLGNYFLADKFVTGYEPIVPGAGPFREGKRELLMVNMRSGTLTTFAEFEQYQDYQKQKLPIIPDYVLHLLSVDTPQEYLMAAQTGGTRQILRWEEDGRLKPVSDTLLMDPVILSGQFGSNWLQVYQVGNYASVVLAGQGRSFNVANFRVLPNIFLIIGDIQRRGLTDVAVANLKFFTPKNP